MAYFALVGKPYFPAAIVTITAGVLFSVVPIIMSLARSPLFDLPMWQKRHFITVWAGHMVGMIVMWLVVYLLTPPDKPQTLLMVYPLWAASAAGTFLAHATEAGIFYMVGAVLFSISVLMALTPTWAPLELGFFMSANMLIQGLNLRRLAKSPPASSSKLLAAAATTIKSER